MINFDFKNECYSCSACSYICPKDAIKFNEKLLPYVDLKRCINCGLCEQTCIKMSEIEYHQELCKDAVGFICKNLNDNERRMSSSGGLFILLAKQTLKNGGYVCGCVYDDDFLPKHILTNEFIQVQKMMGSKYVKSDMLTCIREIEDICRSGKPVLFTGVPCQCAAVKKCLGKYKELTIVNIVCHGSIDREFWNNYLDTERKYGEIAGVTMRDKSKGWENYGLRINYLNGLQRTTFRNDDGYFLRCFTEGLFQRERCLHCNIKGTSIVGDLLLGDGWGMEELFPEFCDTLGVSSVIALTQKGIDMVKEIQDSILCKPINVSQIIEKNRRIVSPANDTPYRKIFQRRCSRNPQKINQICFEYAKPSVLKRIVNKMYQLCINKAK